MPNLILGALSCAAAILAGMGLRRLYRTRRDALRDWQKLLLYLQEQIAYNLTPLPKLLGDYALLHQCAVAQAFAAFPTVGKMPSLPAERWSQMVECVRSLGRSDIAGQSNRLSLALRQADEWVQAAQNDLSQKGDLYCKLCVLGGLALMVVMM